MTLNPSGVPADDHPTPLLAAGGLPVLVADDSAFDRRLAVGVLQKRLGLRVLEADDGRDALAVLDREPVGLVLTDLLMPHVDGLELVEQVRRRHPLVPVVLFTAHGSEEVAIKALQAGAASYVPKKNLERDLSATVEQVLVAAQFNRRRQRFLECVRELDCTMDLDSDPALVPHLIAHLQEHLVRMRLCDENSKIRIGVALEEALLNGVYHGNLGLGSELKEQDPDAFRREAELRRRQPPYSKRRLHVHVRLTPSEARFVIRDEGPGFDVSTLPDPTDPENLLKSTGRGLLLIRTFLDEVRHNDQGNEITLVRRRPH
jgi:CheY-like chemotaxis protein